MPITILSPHSGRPVKVRDQDMGRAIRDEEGRIFYAIPRSDGNGYYAAPTRKGSERDEQRYHDLERKTAEQAEHAQAVQSEPAHDATGPGRPINWGGLVLVLILALILLLGIAYFVFGIGANWLPSASETSPSPQQSVPELPTPLPEPQALSAHRYPPSNRDADHQMILRFDPPRADPGHWAAA